MAAPASPHSAPPAVDVNDERDTENLRSALAGSDRQVLLDVKALLAAPDKLKKACRVGLPMSQRKELWAGIIHMQAPQDATTDYLTSKLDVFDHVEFPTHFPHIPDFGSMMKWNESYIHLTHKRINYAKTLLCVLASNHVTLSHCPMLPDLVCVLLIFFNESSTYRLVERMLLRSKSEEFYMTTNGTDFLRWMKTFSKLLESKNEALYKHMQHTLKIDSGKLFQAWLNRFFIQYLPMRTVFRILDSYLMEGNKILFRVGLGILKLHSKALLACTTQKAFLATLHARMTQQTPNELMATSFDIYLSRSSHIEKIGSHLEENQRTLLNNPPNSERAYFHLPRFCREFNHVSELISTENLYSLWSWLPPAWNLCDPVLLYSSSVHGYSYGTLWHRCCGNQVGENTAIFMLLRDADSDQVVGLYLNKPFPDSPDVVRRKGVPRGSMSLYTGHTASNSATTTTEPLDPQSFLFRLKPQADVFKHFIIKQQNDARSQSYKLKQARLWTEDVERAQEAVSPFLPEEAQLAAAAMHTTPGVLHLPRPSGPSSSTSSFGSLDYYGGMSGGLDDASQSFEPYGLARTDHDGPDMDVLSSMSITISPALDPNGMLSAEMMEAMQARLYTSTIGAHGSHAANPPHALERSDSNLNQRLNAHSMLQAPSRGVQKNQPLNELFANLSTSPISESPGSPSSPVAAKFAAKLAASPPIISPAGSPPQATSPTMTAATAAAGAAAPKGLELAAAASAAPPARSTAASSAASSSSASAAAAAASSSVSPSPSSSSSASGSPGDAMLLMTDDGFGIVETSGVVMFLSADLKTCMSRPSKVFGSPAFTHFPAASSAAAATQQSLLGKFNVASIEVWSFATPGSDAVEQLSPRPPNKQAGSSRPKSSSVI